jgi:hypothetical protein
VRALYLSRLDNNVGDIQSSVYRNRHAFNQEISKRLAVEAYELFPDGDLRDFSLPDSWNDQNASRQFNGEGYELIVVGGGGLIGPPLFDAGWEALGVSQTPIVLWGIGHNVHRDRKPSMAFERFIELNRSKVFSAFRDSCSEKYAPCPSVHNPLLTQLSGARVRNPVAAYLHSNQPSPAWARVMPRLQNYDENLATVLSFLSSSAINITNSYHGALWSRCLGRKTVIYKPFSDKFDCLPKAATLSSQPKHPPEKKYLGQLREASFSTALDLALWLSSRAASG